tara:strand:+ start:157 stop:399 length:243 start_codon:yes stop_codon:yes gene_type:complete
MIQKADPKKAIFFYEAMMERLTTKKLVACFEGEYQEAVELIFFEMAFASDEHSEAARRVWEAYESVCDLEAWYEDLGTSN